MSESAKEELYRVYKPTGNPQADGRVGEAERKDEVNAISNLSKVGLRIIPHDLRKI